MCGILLYHGGSTQTTTNSTDEYIEFKENANNEILYKSGNDIIDSIIPYIARRGPNFSSYRYLRNCNTCWFSSVLSLRQPFTKQSICIRDRFILQFNGELYNDGIEESHESDTQFIVKLLEIVIEDHNDINTQKQVVEIIKKLDGEFAYTIYDLKESIIYFGRDTIGKRSLSYCLDNELGELYISSVTGTTSKNFINCNGGQIYRYNTATKSMIEETIMIKDIPYQINDTTDSNMTNRDSLVENLYKQLEIATNKRITTIHPTHIDNSPISVLFSGGLDCSVIVALICEYFTNNILYESNKKPTIELLNVGFENPRTKLQPSDTPDRKLGINSFNILKNLYPDIDIKLIEVDVQYEEYLNIKPKVIDLMYPKNTEMDLSIAIAFHFASRGKGFITQDNNRVPHSRKGIVLFSGLGADELYGGYHKLANKDTPQLVEELQRQINNIHDRNLNRDDKVIADNGVEVRYPFLDESVIRFSTSEIPINYKINKFILRELAKDLLHLGPIAEEPKRAIQFGAKSAKMTKDGNKNGTDLLK